jgi:hypothetical protein
MLYVIFVENIYIYWAPIRYPECACLVHLHSALMKLKLLA